MVKDIVYFSTLAIFIIVYTLIAVRKIGNHHIPSYVPAIIGACAVLAVGAATPADAWEYVRWDTIFLLLGMMLMTASLDQCGFFTIVSVFMNRRFPERGGFIFAVTVITSFLCMIMLNDAVVLIFTPIVIMSCRRLKADPVPFVIAVFTAANIGCAATFVGAPHCALAGSFGGISFVQYSVLSIPAVIMSTLVSAWILKHHFRGDLEKEYAFNREADEYEKPVLKYRMYFCLSILFIMLALFTINDYTHIGLGAVSLAGGTIAAIATSMSSRESAEYVLRHVNWGILLFFFGLFILIAGVDGVGLVDDIAGLFGLDGTLPSIGTLAAFTAVLSNLISNVPAVLLIGNIIETSGAGITLWACLALISSFGANLTTIGSAANIIGISEAEKRGYKVQFLRHLKVGISITISTCAITIAYLYLVSAILL